MTTRAEIEAIFHDADASLREGPAQVLAMLGGDTQAFNTNLYEARHRATQAALLALADKIDAL